MMPPEMRRRMREKTPFANLSLPATLSLVTTLLLTAPVEEWKELAAKLHAGQAPDGGFGRSEGLQKYAARRLALLAFVAEEVALLTRNPDAVTVLQMMREMDAEEGRP